MRDFDEVYLDNNATTRVLPEVGEAMLRVLGEGFGNASSAHGTGDRARAELRSAREAVATLRERGERVTLLVLESLIPLPTDVGDILDRHERVLIVEENENGLLAEMLFGQLGGSRVQRVNKVGSMIRPDEIVDKVER